MDRESWIAGRDACVKRLLELKAEWEDLMNRAPHLADRASALSIGACAATIADLEPPA